MAKMTLLEMVQNILSALDSDEVNSVSDTVESLQVAEIVKETFYEQFSGLDLPENDGLIRLNSMSDVSRPNYLKLPSDVSDLDWLRYRDYAGTGSFRELMYLHPADFIERRLMEKGYNDNAFLTTDPSGLQYYINTDRTPTYFTIFDDLHIATDAYDSRYESMLQTSNVMAFGTKARTFELDDDYVPPIDTHLFPLLLSEAKSTAFINLKQISSSKEEQRARRQRIRMQSDKYRSKDARYGNRKVFNYARNRR